MKKKSYNQIFLIYILALPFSWVEIGNISLYRIIVTFISLFWILKNRLIVKIPKNKTFYACLAYFGYCILNSFLYSSFNIAFGMISLFLIGLIFLNVELNDEIINKIDRMWLIVGIAFILLFLFGQSVQIGEWGARKSLIILGTRTDPNEFASFFVVFLPIIFSCILSEKKLIKIILLSTIIFSGSYIVLMSGSRAALISLIIALFITFILSKKISIGKSLLLGLLSAMLLILVFELIIPLIPQSTIERLSLDALVQDKGSGRTEIWSMAMNKYVDGNPIKWLLGYGYNGMEVYYYYGKTSTMHNQFIQNLVSFGIFGLILYLKLVFTSFNSMLKNNRKYIGAFVGLMFMSLTITMSPSYKILWILLFICGMNNRIGFNKTE